MGQFSWLYSDNNKQVVDNKRADTYLLVPPPFQEKYGVAIYEGCYDGYGRFGKYDVYELVAEWNRAYLSQEMLRDRPEFKNYCGLYDFEIEDLKAIGLTDKQVKEKDLEQRQHYYNAAVKRYEASIKRLEDYRGGKSDEEMGEKYGPDWKRQIGIDIACYDEQNASIPFPIKITTKVMGYNSVKPSQSEPNQGWEG